MSDGEKTAVTDPRRILQLLDKYKRRVTELERNQGEPIAIVGLGCRLPGGIEDPEAFWRALVQGTDAIAEIPPERWDVDSHYDSVPETRGKMYTRAGGFLRSVDGFDPQFFGISPREAVGMDPQQRLLLEVSWEALEHAGIVASELAGRRAGVFVGVGQNEYARAQMQGEDLTRIDTYTGTGNGLCFAAGRISYVLGLHGPSLTLNTACSSSLVAVHLACQSLRAGECELALAGGVHVMLSPVGSVFLSQARALAPDGRCKTFDASADGYGRAEGCGMVVLKRLRDAQRDGDTVLAVLRGTAVNHDGRSGGLTVPSGRAQASLLREALERAGVTPSEVQYVEAHGTGTSLGDPIEVEALGTVLGAGRPADRPLLLGSVKTNIGHLEEAAGVAGLIKVVLSLQNRLIPAHLHFTRPSPHIAWDSLAVRVVAAPLPWSGRDGKRVAGVSSFGLSGTNAHAIVEEAPSVEAQPAAPVRTAELFVVSARSAAALAAQASRLLGHLAAHAALELADVAFSLATTRSAMEHRLAVAASTHEALASALAAAAQGQTPPGGARGRVSLSGVPRVVFVFPGDSSQRFTLSAAFLAEEPVFRAALEDCDRVITAQAGVSVLAELTGARQGQRETEPLRLFAVQVALAALWRAWGVTPDSVVGHGAGQVAAAHVAGSLSLADAVARICKGHPLAEPPFSETVQQLLESGHGLFVELSPHPSLVQSVEACLRSARREAAVVASLRLGQGERAALLEALGALWVRGFPVIWAQLFPTAGRRVPLPTYPFQRQRYWLAAPASATPPLDGRTPQRDSDDKFLELIWEPARVPVPKISAGRFLLLGGGGEAGPALRGSLVAAGHAVVHETASDSSAAGVRARIVAAFGGQAPTAVVHLGSLDGGAPELDAAVVERALARGCDSALATVQALADLGHREAPRLWFVTRGAQAVGKSDVWPAQAPLVGLGRVVALEHAALRCTHIDLDPAVPDGEADALRAELLADDAESELALRGDERHVARIVRCAPADAAPGVPIRADGSYLVTGGLGGLGLGVADWLARQGAGHLILVGRSGASRAAHPAAVAALEARGTRVTVARADVADRAELAQLLRAVAESGLPLRGVIHAAGVLDDGLLAQQTPARLRAVMAPKVLGALHLDALTRDAPLDFFVMYASAAGLLGSPGQGNYAAANAFLDALAHHLRRCGRPALSIDWGAFAEVGMAAAQQRRGAQLTSRGLRGLTPAEGLTALAQLLGERRTQVAVVPLPSGVRQSPPWMMHAASRRLSRLAASRRPDGRPAGAPQLLVLSANDERALRAQAQRLARHLEVDASASLGEVAGALATTRSQLEERFTLVAADAPAAIERLRAFAGAGDRSGARRVSPKPPEIAFLFTGQGSQYPNMARALYETHPVFRRAVDACAEILDSELDQRLLPLLYSESHQPGVLDATAYAQPALFTIEYALAQLWRSLGIEPSHLLGHSVGEYVAACVAGVFSLEDGLRLIAARGRLMQALPEGGAMVAIAASEAAVSGAMAPYGDAVSIAAINAPESVTISGSAAPVLAVAAHFAALGTRTRRLPVSHAFHNARMQPMLAAFTEVARRVRYAAPQIPIVSNLDGKLAGERMQHPEYWLAHVLAPVRFADGVDTLLAAGVTHMIELGPDPALSVLGRLSDRKAQATWLSSLRRGRDDRAVFLESLGELWSAGAAVRWDALHAGAQKPVTLPADSLEGDADARFWDAVASGSAERVLALLSPHGELPAHARAALPDIIGALASYRASAAKEDAATGAVSRAATAFVERLGTLSPPAREAAVLDVVRGAVAAVLGVSDRDAIEPQRGFADLGLDSLMAVELRGRIQDALGVSLGATAAFDHPNSERLARATLSALFGESGPRTQDDPALERAAQLDDEQAAARIDEILADLED